MIFWALIGNFFLTAKSAKMAQRAAEEFENLKMGFLCPNDILGFDWKFFNLEVGS